MDVDYRRKWSLEEGLELIRALQPETRAFNYHLTLAGGVLNKGESDKDLDLVFVPMESTGEAKSDELLTYLKSLWGEGKKLGDYGQSEHWEMSVPWTEYLAAERNLLLDPTNSLYQDWSRALTDEEQRRIVFQHPSNAAMREKYEPKPQVTVMAHKVKFERSDGKRIDVFIVGGAATPEAVVANQITF